MGDPDAPLPGPDDERFEVLMGAGFMGVAGVDMVFVIVLVVCALGLGARWSGLGVVGCTVRGWLARTNVSKDARLQERTAHTYPWYERLPNPENNSTEQAGAST